MLTCPQALESCLHAQCGPKSRAYLFLRSSQVAVRHNMQGTGSYVSRLDREISARYGAPGESEMQNRGFQPSGPMHCRYGSSPIFLFFYFILNLAYSRWTSSLPSCLWSQRIFPSLPGSRLTIFYRDASSALLQLVNQWLNCTRKITLIVRLLVIVTKKGLSLLTRCRC